VFPVYLKKVLKKQNVLFIYLFILKIQIKKITIKNIPKSLWVWRLNP